jgi:hypothetical protein
VIQSEALASEPPAGSGQFSAQPLVGAGSGSSGGGGSGGSGGGEGGEGGTEPQYCQTTLGGGASNGLGGIEYSVQSAACVPDGLLFCVGADCADLVGASIVIIDYGFLQNQAGN